MIYSWNKNNLILGRSCSDLCFYQASHQPCDNESCTICQSSSHIFEQHNGASNKEIQGMWRNACLELGAGDLSERHKLNELKGDVQFVFR